MCTYIEHCADRLLRSLGGEPLYGAEMPFDFMTNISCAPAPNIYLDGTD
jgi:ribonucleoside-diphosphate reductase subunit M2